MSIEIKSFNSLGELLDYVSKTRDQHLHPSMYETKTAEEFVKILADTQLPEERQGHSDLDCLTPTANDIKAFDQLIGEARRISPNPRPRRTPAAPGRVGFLAKTYQETVDAIASLARSTEFGNRQATPQSGYDNMVTAIKGARSVQANLEPAKVNLWEPEVSGAAMPAPELDKGQYVGFKDESNDPPDSQDYDPFGDDDPDEESDDTLLNAQAELKEDFHELLARIAANGFANSSSAQQRSLDTFAKGIHQKHFPDC